MELWYALRRDAMFIGIWPLELKMYTSKQVRLKIRPLYGINRNGAKEIQI